MARQGRPIKFPDPDDRSKNQPTYVLERGDVLNLYNQENSGEEAKRVVKSVQDWFTDRAKQEGWDDIDFHEGKCILRNTRVENT